MKFRTRRSELVKISLGVMIAPLEPSLSLRSWFANNSKGRCSWNLFLKSSFGGGGF